MNHFFRAILLFLIGCIYQPVFSMVHTEAEIQEYNDKVIENLKHRSDLKLIVGAVNTGSDYNRFHNDFDVTLDGDGSRVDFDKTDLTTLIVNLNDNNQMKLIFDQLAGKFEKIMFDLSVIKGSQESLAAIIKCFLQALRPGGTFWIPLEGGGVSTYMQLKGKWVWQSTDPLVPDNDYQEVSNRFVYCTAHELCPDTRVFLTAPVHIQFFKNAEYPLKPRAATDAPFFIPYFKITMPTEFQSKLSLLQTNLIKLSKALTSLKQGLNKLQSKLSGKPATSNMVKEVYIALVNSAPASQIFDPEDQVAQTMWTFATDDLPVGEARSTQSNIDTYSLKIEMARPNLNEKNENENRIDLFKNCYTNCLKLADQNKITTITFSFTYGLRQKYDINEIAPISLDAVFKYLTDHPESNIKEVRFIERAKWYVFYETKLKEYAAKNEITVEEPNQFLKNSSQQGSILCFKFT